MSIKVGDSLEQVTVQIMGAEGPESVSTRDLFGDSKVVLFAVPGAFTPTCSSAHLPGFVAQSDKILGSGVDLIACISVNDIFVMDAWAKQGNAGDIKMIADGMGHFANAVGMTVDFSERGMGIRSDRYAMIIDKGKVTWLAREKPKTLEVSTAEAVLEALS